MELSSDQRRESLLAGSYFLLCTLRWKDLKVLESSSPTIAAFVGQRLADMGFLGLRRACRLLGVA